MANNKSKDKSKDTTQQIIDLMKSATGDDIDGVMLTTFKNGEPVAQVTHNISLLNIFGAIEMIRFELYQRELKGEL